MGGHVSAPFFVGGVPVGFNLPAQFDNKVFYADADNGADGRTGLSPEKAFKTIEAGYAALRTNKHDVLVLSANTSFTLEDELVVSKNRVHIISADFAGRHTGQSTKINALVPSTGSAISAIKNTGIRNHFRGLKVTSGDTLSTSLYGIAEVGEFAVWEDCEILKTSDLNQTTAAEVLHNGDSAVFRRCTFGNGIYTVTVARQNILFTRETVTGKVARDVLFEDCIFLSRCNSATFVNLRATVNDIERLALFRRCFFHAVKTSPTTQDEAIGIASALTDAQIGLHDCATLGITNIATSSRGVFTNQPAGADLGGLMIQAT